LKLLKNIYERRVLKKNRGRKPTCIENTLNGIWWVLCNGAIWNQLPERYGKWNSVYRFFKRWSDCAVWEELLKYIAQQKEQQREGIIIDASHVKVHQDASRYWQSPEEQLFGKTKGGRNTKISAAVTLSGKALSLKLVCGNEHDSLSALGLLPELIEGLYILADKAYDTNAIRDFIAKGKAIAVIPPKKNRKQPIDYDKEVGKLRHRVENFFARIKRFRRVNTRYDKTSSAYMGFVTLSAIADWAKE